MQKISKKILKKRLKRCYYKCIKIDKKRRKNMNKKIIFIIIAILIIGAVVGVIILGSKKNESDKTKETNAEQTTFEVKYQDVEITPGKEFSADRIKEEANLSEIPSCAFNGVDKVYTYENFEIIVASVDGKDTVYSVYFDNDAMETTEGVKVTDTKDKMIEKYGNNYKQELGNKYIYTNNNVELSFIIESDIITAIEYTLIAK